MQAFSYDIKGRFQMARVYNFSAGPAVLPEEVLKEAAEEMLVLCQLSDEACKNRIRRCGSIGRAADL